MKFIPILMAGAMALAGAVHANPAAPESEGEVRKVDKAQGKVTLRHGPLKNLDMPAMTMVFRVVDPRMLESLREGDKVRFAAARIDGAITLTRIEPSRSLP